MSLTPIRTLRDILSGADPQSTVLRLFDNGNEVSKISRAEFGERIRRIAMDLRRQGIRTGDPVSIAMGNTVEFIIVFLAVTWIRAIAAPLNPNYTEKEFQFYMEDIKSKLLIVSESGHKAAEPAAKSCKIPVCYASLSNLRPSESNIEQPIIHSGPTYIDDPALPTDVALYLHTSGTTSRPKLVPLSHHNLCTSMGNVRNTYELDETDTTYMVMPLFHIHGLVCGLFASLCSGGCIVLPTTGKFSASVFWKDVVASKATWYTAVPTMHQILLERSQKDLDLISQSNLKFIRSCSASLAPVVMERMEKCFGAPVLEAYAMTEASHQMTSNPLPKNGPRKPGSVGRSTNVQVAILDDKNVKISKTGVIGKVCIRGENVTTGYFNRPEANRDDFAAGWFHTGDQGFLDQDGYLFLTGRLKELINRGGEKISPIEIDSVLLRMDGVAEAVAFGGPHAKYGEEVCCAIVPKTGTKLTENDVLVYCSHHLSKEKIPSKIFVVNEVPKTATGKIQRRFVAEAMLLKKSKL